MRAGGLAPNGFVALAELDDNGDGVVDASDAAWADLLLWNDRDRDGRSAGGELQRIGDSGVTALETGSLWVGRRDEWGNEFRYMSRFRLGGIRGDARRTYYDVFLQSAP